jgi:hypothetical protein
MRRPDVRSIVFRCARLPANAAALALALAFACAEVRAQVVHVVGDRTPAGVGLVTVTPSTPPAAAAAATCAAGTGFGRGLVMAGFAEDIGSHDFLTVGRGKSARRVASPWIDSGTRVVAARVQSWLDAFMSAGGSADVVVFDCRADLGASRYSASWAAIRSDSRCATMLRALGVRSLPPNPHLNAAFAARWQALAGERLDVALATHLSPALQRALPATAVMYRGHAVRPASAPRASLRFGTHDLVRADACSGETECIRSARSAISRVAGAGSRRVAVLLDGSLAEDPAAMRELAIHAALGGASRIIASLPGGRADARMQIPELNAELSARLAGSDAFRSLPAPTGASPGLAVSCGAAASRIHVRVSVPGTVDAVRVTMSDGREAFLPIAPGSGGAWFNHSPGEGIRSIEAVEVQSAPAVRSVLYDSFVSPTMESRVAHAQRYMLVGQHDVDRAIVQTGIIDPNKVIARVEQLIASGNGSRWGVLDFEEPFDQLWDTGDSDPRYRPAIKSMIDTVRALRTRFPEIRWTFYGMPRVKYWIAGPSWRVWADLSKEERETQYRIAVEPVAAIMEELDFIMPGVYDVYEDAIGMPTTETARQTVEASWRRANVEAIKFHFRERGLPEPSIIPMVSPWFQPGGRASVMRPIPSQEFIAEQVRPLLDAGASGVALWGAMRHFHNVATWSKDHPSQAFMDLRSEVRGYFARDYWPSSTLSSVPVRWDQPEAAALLRERLDEQLSNAISAVAECP